MFDATKIQTLVDSLQHKPTDEQLAIVQAFLEGKSFVIEAGAGSGKTTTLKMLGQVDPSQKGIYFAYNKSAADDAKASFPKNVKCYTSHGLAYYAVIIQGRNGQIFNRRLNSPRVPSWKVARQLGIHGTLKISEERTLKDTQVARIALETVAKFCQSADEELLPRHVPFVEGLAPENRDDFREIILEYADKVWFDLTNPHGTLKFEPDHYRKMWCLTHPRLIGDYVLLDEAQDSDPCIAAMFNEQTHMQRILVGDRCQAIYGWRGAVDAMETFPGERFYLTQSFRFGPDVATEANKWLRYLESPLELRGFEKVASVVGPAINPDAVLCRTNAGAVTEVIETRKLGKKVALVGGGKALVSMAKAAQELMNGGTTDHPDFYTFTSWAEVIEYVENDPAGADLKVFIKMIDRFGIPAIIEAMNNLVEEQDADLIVSTAHKAKGREWNVVRISNDYREPKEAGQVISREEAMLAYVSVTRAKLHLDRSGLSFIDRFDGPKSSFEAMATGWKNSDELVAIG